MLKIGITGVDGFVGSSVYKYLKKHNYEVIGFSRRRDSKNYTYWDITNKIAHPEINIDILVHCAGTVDDWASYKECYKNNCLGTQNALDSFPNLLKFIYISSCSVYDSKDKKIEIVEETPCGHFLNGYSQSKYNAEQCVLGSNSRYQKIILRPHVIYGENDKKIIPRLLKAHKLNRFVVLGDGENSISITHIENLCLAIKNCIELEVKFDKEIFNITDLESVKVKDLIAHVKKKFDIKANNFYIQKKAAYVIGFLLETLFKLLRIKKAPFISRYLVHQMGSDHRVSINKAKKVLKYNPKKSFLDL